MSSETKQACAEVLRFVLQTNTQKILLYLGTLVLWYAVCKEEKTNPLLVFQILDSG